MLQGYPRGNSDTLGSVAHSHGVREPARHAGQSPWAQRVSGPLNECIPLHNEHNSSTTSLKQQRRRYGVPVPDFR